MPAEPPHQRHRNAALLRSMFDAAVDRARPAVCLPGQFPVLPNDGRLIILAIGKAAGAMAAVAAEHYSDGLASGRVGGLVATRHGFAGAAADLPGFEVIEAGHPVPDAASERAAARALELAASATGNDQLLVLLSGGASAILSSPAAGLTLADKQAVTQALLRAGAPIGAINTVRRHISRVKGGRLASAAGETPSLTLAISDVPGDAPEAVGSGPTVGDSTTLYDARQVVQRFIPAEAARLDPILSDLANETPKPDAALWQHHDFRFVATPAMALESGAALARADGFVIVALGDELEGEARERAVEHAKLAREALSANRRVVILSGGGLTVTVRGQGRGGPNQEYALALAAELRGQSGVWALAGDTDGTDGGRGSADDPAGAFVFPQSCDRATALSLDPATFLADNDATTFFSHLGDLLQTGPTLTNVNDFRAILVDPIA